MNEHWTEQDFLNKLYEVGRTDSHLDACAECGARWKQYLGSRRQLIERQPEIAANFLSQQRLRIQSRVEQAPQRSPFLRWSPAFAVAAMALCAVLWKQPVAPVAPVAKRIVETATARTDAQLMADIYRSVYESEPGAVQAVEGLFEAKR